MLKNIMTICVLIFASVCILYFAAGDHFGVLVHSSFLVIILQSVFFMTVLNSPIVKIYFVFSYLFFGCIPYLEHSNRVFSYWGLSDVSSDLLFFINILIFLLNLTVVISYRFSGKMTFKAIQRFYLNSEVLYYIKSNRFKYKDSFAFSIILALSSSFFVLYINNFNFINLRSEEHTSELQSRPHLVC